MTYNKQTWVDGVAGATPINATRLNYMESGIAAADPGALAVASLRQTFSYGAPYPASTYSLMGWDTADVDTHSGFNKNRVTQGASNDSRWTVPAGQAGLYQIQAFICLTTITAGNVLAHALLKNGAYVPNATSILSAGRTDSLTAATNLVTVNLAVGDYIESYVYSNQTYTTRYSTGDGSGSLFSIRRIA
jgi:hypothetical protein